MNHLIRKIILVDDDEDDRDLFSEALESLNLQKTELLQFKNGKELLDYLKEVDCSIATLVFLDLNMPIISGMEVLKQLRRTFKVNDVFVTIYSTSSSKKDVENAYNYGANGYLRKPSSFQQLRDLINKAIYTSSTHRGKQLVKDKFVLNKQ